jgi:hypothetical protein
MKKKWWHPQNPFDFMHRFLSAFSADEVRAMYRNAPEAFLADHDMVRAAVGLKEAA